LHEAWWAAAAVDASLPAIGHDPGAGESGGLPVVAAVRAARPHADWAIEGATGLVAQLTARLREDRYEVVDVPAMLAARVRVLSTGHGGKHDNADAISVVSPPSHRAR
jgi:hypothetical protein